MHHHHPFLAEKRSEDQKMMTTTENCFEMKESRKKKKNLLVTTSTTTTTAASASTLSASASAGMREGRKASRLQLLPLSSPLVGGRHNHNGVDATSNAASGNGQVGGGGGGGVRRGDHGWRRSRSLFRLKAALFILAMGLPGNLYVLRCYWNPVVVLQDQEEKQEEEEEESDQVRALYLAHDFFSRNGPPLNFILLCLFHLAGGVFLPLLRVL